LHKDAEKEWLGEALWDSESFAVWLHHCESFVLQAKDRSPSVLRRLVRLEFVCAITQKCLDIGDNDSETPVASRAPEWITRSDIADGEDVWVRWHPEVGINHDKPVIVEYRRRKELSVGADPANCPKRHVSGEGILASRPRHGIMRQAIATETSRDDGPVVWVDDDAISLKLARHPSTDTWVVPG
jgi:hypothetical protein